MTRKLLKHLRYALLALFMFGANHISGQILINAPAPAPNQNSQNSGNGTAWDRICAGSSFNEYFVNVSWTGTPAANNEFILELSDAKGDFSAPHELNREGGKNTASGQFFMQFSIPNSTQGSGYKLRIRGTNPAKTSSESSAFEMYYQGITSNIHISPNGDGTTPGSVCSTSGIKLSVDNIPNASNYKYQWFRSGTGPLQETGPTIQANQDGMYEVYVDYGICTGSSNAFSNLIDVTVGAGNQGIAINPPSKTALCKGQTETLQINTTNSSWNYQWYKNETAIPGATAPTFTVNSNSAGFEGDYQIEISATGICTERSAPITITNTGSFTVSRDNPENIVVLPSQPQTLKVSTTASNPTFEWYRNSNVIAGQTNNYLEITQEGTYYAAVSTGGACGTTVNSDTTTSVAPDSFAVTIAYNPSNYEDCTVTDVVLEVALIEANTSSGKIDATSTLADSFDYQWKLNNDDIAGAVGKNISLSDLSENGNYTLSANLNDYASESNQLQVQLLSNETISITSNGTVFCDGDTSLEITTATDLTDATFEWQRDGTTLPKNSTELAIKGVGLYRLALNRNGCTIYSNEITITGLDENLIQLSNDGDVVFPEGSSKTVTATGGTSYQWFDENNNQVSSTADMNFTTEGAYTLVANIDNCQIVKPIKVVYLELFTIPNVITPNGDGANDQWVIPNSYSNKSDVSVVIYNDKGNELLNVNGYHNNWPESSMTFPKQNMVFYYIIKNANETLKQGTITVIR